MLTRADRNLILEALAMAASRHESMARVQKFGRRHDQKAAAMRKLRHELHALALGERLVLDHGATVTLPEDRK